MKRVLFSLVCFVLPICSHAETILQCAVDKVVPKGARVNVLESKGKFRANLIFGTTVSGTMYSVTKSKRGYSGTIKNKPGFTFNLNISRTEAGNANVRGHRAHLTALYPNLESATGSGEVDVELVCGEKATDRWN